MKIREIMTRNVRTVSPDDNLVDVAAQMLRVDTGFIPVCDNDRIVGAITDRDIAIRAVAEGRDPNETRVRDCMSRDVVTCSEDSDVEEAAQLMEDRQIRRLVILDRDRRLCGVVSLGDLATHRGARNVSGEVLEQVSQPS